MPNQYEVNIPSIFYIIARASRYCVQHSMGPRWYQAGTSYLSNKSASEWSLRCCCGSELIRLVIMVSRKDSYGTGVRIWEHVSFDLLVKLNNFDKIHVLWRLIVITHDELNLARTLISINLVAFGIWLLFSIGYCTSFNFVENYV